MKPFRMLLLITGIISLGTLSAQAQTLSPPTAPRAPRPTLSPYLNLLDRNNSTAFNYYNRVRPRQAFDDYRQSTSQNLRALDRRIDRTNEALREQSANSQLAPTGHTTRFLDLGGYFGGRSTGRP